MDDDKLGSCLPVLVELGMSLDSPMSGVYYSCGNSNACFNDISFPDA